MKFIYKFVGMITILNLFSIMLIIIDYQWFRFTPPNWQFGEFFYIGSLILLAILPATLVCKLESLQRQKNSAVALFAISTGMIWVSTFLILYMINPDGLIQYLEEKIGTWK